MLPESIPHYSVGPFFGLATNLVLAFLCFVNFALHPHYRPLRNLFFFYVLLTFFFFGWVIYGLQRSPESILFGYKISQAGLALLPLGWVWFMLSLLNKKPRRLSWIIILISLLLASLAFFGKGPWFFGFPLEIHPTDVEVLRPRSYLLRPLINFFGLTFCLFFFFLIMTKFVRFKDERPVYLLPFGIGLLLWFLGGLHDAFLSFGIVLLSHKKILWLGSFWLSISLAVAVAVHYRSLEQAVREARDVFERFVPPAYLRRIAAQGLRSIRLGEADQQEVTILCCDIRGFTPLSQKLNPSQLISFVNRLLERITKVVARQEGVIDKFLGDAVLCIFEGDDSAQRAVTCGVDMLAAVKSFNADEDRPIDQAVQIGVGLHTGPVILGTIGSSERMDSTVLGLTVNLAKRLEEATKPLGVDMLISNQVASRLPRGHNHRWRELGEVWLKGGLTPVTVFEVYDHDPPETRDLKDRVEPILSEGVRLIRAGHLDTALAKLQQVQSTFFHDSPLRFLVNSLQNALVKVETNRGNFFIDLR